MVEIKLPNSTQIQTMINELEQVKAELEAIKNGTLNVSQDGLIAKLDELLTKQEELQNKIDGVIENNSINTRLTGSNVEEEIAIERGVYKETVRTTLVIPEGFTGVLIKSIVYGITGDMSGADDGYMTFGYAYDSRFGLGTPVFLSRDDYKGMRKLKSPTSISNNPSMIIAEGINETKTPNLHVAIPYRVDLGDRLRVDLSISGTFNDEEGVDAEVIVRWLK